MSQITDNERAYLELAIKSAESAYKLGSYPVGAILVIDGKLLGSGENKINETKSFFDHAEMGLISTYATDLYTAYQAGKYIVLYSTLEPCIQCLGAAVTNHVTKIIYITKDPNGGACDLKHDNIGDWYKHWWPEIIHAPISEKPLVMMMDFFHNEIKKGNTKWPEKMIRLYNLKN